MDDKVMRRIPNKTARNGKPVVIGIPPTLHERLAAITAHSTHVSEVTARDVAKALPAFAGTKNGEPERPPLPDWARELVETLTAEKAADLKKALLAAKGEA